MLGGGDRGGVDKDGGGADQGGGTQWRGQAPKVRDDPLPALLVKGPPT